MNDFDHPQRVIVRLRTEKDLAETAQVLVAVHAADGYPVEGVERPIEWLTSARSVSAWVAEAGGGVVGHVSVGVGQDDHVQGLLRGKGIPVGEKIAFLERLFVSPNFRRNATGWRLVSAATDFARAKGLPMVLDVMAKDRAAIRLYERLGWHRIGEATHMYGDAEEAPAFWYLAPEH